MSASSITISFKAEGSASYLADVTELVVGNMVDPVTGKFWFQPSPATNPWTWNNDGSNANKFGLMANYKYNNVEKTAYSQLVIDPTQLSGDVTVEATLCTCAIDGATGNPILKYKSATVNGSANGAVSISDWGTEKPQPSCDFYGE